MKMRFVWIALAVSLALNLSFVGVWGYSAVTADEIAKADTDYIEEVSTHLLLNEEQHAALLDLRRKAQDRWRGLSGGSAALRDSIVRSLAAENYDQEAVKATVAGRLDERAEVISAIMGDLHGFMATLSPNQREAMLSLVERRGFLRGIFRGRSRSSEER